MAQGGQVQGLAVQSVLSGGIVSGTVLSSGGVQNIQDGALASAVQILNSGVQNISSGGQAVSAQVIGGGVQNVLLNGSAADTFASAGGTVNLDGGTLSNYTAAAGGILNTYADATINGTAVFSDGAIVNINKLYSSAMHNVTVENMSANNTHFYMNVDLVNQTADTLTVNSSFAGTSNYLHLKNVASSSAETTGDGIELVKFTSATPDSGSFSLYNIENKGAYNYKLFQGTAGGVGSNYFLRSVSYSDTFKTMLNVPLMNVMLARTGMNSLQRRMGDLQEMDNTAKKQGIWMRSYYKNLTVEDLIKTDLKLFGAEAGYDWLFRADEPTKLYAGVMLGYTQANNIKTEKEDGSYDSGDGDAPSVGIYATLSGDSRWFVDIAARNFWTKLDMTNTTPGSVPLIYKPARNIFAASIEAGKTYINELEQNTSLRFQPKAEVTYMKASADKTEVENGLTDLSYDAVDYLNTKVGVTISYTTQWTAGLKFEPLFELAYGYQLLGKGEVSYDNAIQDTNFKGGMLETSIGMNMQLADGLYWYALGSYEKGSKINGWGLNAGIRFAFSAFGGGSSDGDSKDGKKAKSVKKSKSSSWEYGDELINTDKKKSSKKRQLLKENKKKEKVVTEKPVKEKKRKKKTSFTEDTLKRMSDRMNDY